MPATVRSATVIGLDVVPVDVEVEVLLGVTTRRDAIDLA